MSVIARLWSAINHQGLICGAWNGDDFADLPEDVQREFIEAVREGLRDPSGEMVDAMRDIGPAAPYGAQETIDRWQAGIDALTE
jgi:hypothetical protein